MSKSSSSMEENKKSQESEQAKKPQTVGKIKEGDYMIHLFIQETRYLRMDKADTVDPIIRIECFGKTKWTSVKDDIGSNATVVWNEHAFFEPTGLTPGDVQNEKLRIKVLDQRMLKDQLIGVYEMDISYIYFKEEHAILNQWVGLSNPSAENFNVLSGHLKMSVSVIGENDNQIALTDDTGVDRTELQLMQLPPHISVKYYQFKFRIIKGQLLPKMDTYGD